MLPTLCQVSESTPAGWYSGTMTWWVILPGGWLCTRFYNTWSWNEETNFQVRTTEGFVVEKLERIYTAMAKVTNYLINIRSLLMPLFFLHQVIRQYRFESDRTALPTDLQVGKLWRLLIHHCCLFRLSWRWWSRKRENLATWGLEVLLREGSVCERRES